MTDELTLITPTWSAGHPVEGRRGFAINGRPLAEMIELGGNACILDGQDPDAARGYVKQLLLRAPSPFPSGRVPLYVCPQCRDLGCGAITVRVTLVDDCYVWSELSNESHSGEAPATWLADDERAFYFARDHYLGVIY